MNTVEAPQFPCPECLATLIESLAKQNHQNGPSRGYIHCAHRQALAFRSQDGAGVVEWIGWWPADKAQAENIIRGNGVLASALGAALVAAAVKVAAQQTADREPGSAGKLH